MSEPNKQEQEQIESTLQQLERLQKSTDSLYRRMAINGRSQEYYSPIRKVSEGLSNLSDLLCKKGM
ncbi:hypothetical protein GCM10010912_30030 [Paenibacillus albidus]|uniref:Uncharacterized protein n=1 Tax=Paenibacillus albidus TaxID=2041023 RepID=A0A917CCD5_9BACL|nr:hypothetical protein [Paenibacillus albidus]GGF82914.1 hypothetical protein GCM10010912_30030 [Paenibacillus albidus]